MLAATSADSKGRGGASVPTLDFRLGSLVVDRRFRRRACMRLDLARWPARHSVGKPCAYARTALRCLTPISPAPCVSMRRVDPGAGSVGTDPGGKTCGRTCAHCPDERLRRGQSVDPRGPFRRRSGPRRSIAFRRRVPATRRPHSSHRPEHTCVVRAERRRSSVVHLACLTLSAGRS